MTTKAKTKDGKVGSLKFPDYTLIPADMALDEQLRRNDIDAVDDFINEHGLKIIVHERPPYLREKMRLPTYFASFEHAEVKEGSMLAAAYGEGDMPEGAIVDYLTRIAGKLLVLHAHKGEMRKEIQCPTSWVWGVTE